jgi:hypothetical protein
MYKTLIRPVVIYGSESWTHKKQMKRSLGYFGTFSQPEGSRKKGTPKLMWLESVLKDVKSKSKAVPLHAMEALGGRGGTAPTHSRPRH